MLSQLGAGRDGVRYRATDRDDGSDVEIVLLVEALADPARWKFDRRGGSGDRVDDRPSLVEPRIVALDLDGDLPYVALEWVGRGPTLAELGREEVGSDRGDRRTWPRALAAGHRLGLALGSMAPGSIRSRTSRGVDLVLDWTGLDVDSIGPGQANRFRSGCLVPGPGRSVKGGEPDAASDVYSLGAILDWWLVGLASTGFGSGSDAGRLLREMLDGDPSARGRRPECRGRATDERKSSPAGRLQVGTSAHVADTSFTTGFDGDEAPGPHVQAVWIASSSAGSGSCSKIAGPKGGMGTVYRGEDLWPTARQVAIKVLSPAFAGRPEALRRFHKEARLSRRGQQLEGRQPHRAERG